MATNTYGERFNFLWFIALGGTAFAIGLVVYFSLLRSAFGVFDLRELSPTAEGTNIQNVAVLRSQYNLNAQTTSNPDAPAAEWLETNLNRWTGLLQANDFAWTSLDDAALEAGALEDVDVLLLSSVQTLSDLQKDQIKAFMSAGGSVLATWAPGVYAPDGTWLGWDFPEEVFGIEFIDFIQRGESGYRVYQDTFPGYTPAGLYRKDTYFENTYAAAPGTFGYDFERERMQLLAEESGFTPLTGYQWADSLSAIKPRADFALAAPVRSNYGASSTAVTYYTWVGGDPASAMADQSAQLKGFRRFTLRASTPLTAGIPSGYRMKVGTFDGPVRFRVAEPRTHAAGFWHDFATSDETLQEALATTTGLVYGTYGKGRFVYAGHELTAMEYDNVDQMTRDRVFTNALSWLKREPISWVQTWPYPYQAAAVVAGVGESKPENLARAWRTLKAENVPASFFIRSEAAAANASFLREVHNSERGSVGVLGDLLRAEDGSQELQLQRLKSARERMTSVLGTDVLGYHSQKEGQFSYRTMLALRDAGYRYFLPDSVGRSATPEIKGEELSRLTQIDKTARTDREALATFAERANGDLRDVFTEDITRVGYEGGLYTLYYSSDVLAGEDMVHNLRSVAQTLKAKNFWVADADEMAAWWRHRNNLHTRVERPSPNRLVVSVTNNNDDVANGIGLFIALGQEMDATQKGGFAIRAELVNTPVPKGENARLTDENTVLVLNINNLGRHQSRTFHIDLFPKTNQVES